MSDDPNPSTQFLVSEIHKQQKKTKTIGIAAAVVVVAVIIWFLFIKQPAPDELKHGAPAASGAAAPAPH